MSTAAAITAGKPAAFRLGNRRFAVGLLWLDVQGKTRVAKAARAEAAKPGVKANLYATRNVDGIAQFGLAHTSDGLKPGAIAAAAALAARERGSWVGVFQIPTGWWFVSARDDLLMPDGDCFFADESAARLRLDEAIAEGGWRTVFAPKGWHEGASHSRLEQLLASARGPKLAATSTLGGGNLVKILAVAAICGGIFAAWQITTGLNEAAEREAAMEATRARLAREDAARLTLSQIAPPWETLANPGEVIDACNEAFKVVQPDTPGWAMTDITCRRNGGDYAAFWNWQRMFGTLDWLKSWIEANASMPVDGPHFVENGEKAYASVPLGDMAERGETDLMSATDAERILLSSAQAIGARAQLEGLRRVLPPAGIDPSDFVPPAFAPIGFNAEVVSLTGWNDLFNSMPGLIIDEIVLDASTGTYRIKGDIYVRN